MEILHAEIDQLEASIASLSQELSDLAAAVAELDAALAEATSIWNAESAKNTQTIADAQAAGKATEQAMKVLKDFYAKASTATSLVQAKKVGKDGQPEIFSDERYTGMGGDSGGVMGMIEVILADFQRLESDTTAAEEQSMKEYRELANDTEVTRPRRTGTSSTRPRRRRRRTRRSRTLEPRGYCSMVFGE